MLILVEGSSYQSSDCVSKAKLTTPVDRDLHGVGVQDDFSPNPRLIGGF